MTRVIVFSCLILLFGLVACDAPAPDGATKEPLIKKSPDTLSSFWKNATIYFLLTDRFYNGDPSNDLALGRNQDGAFLRNFMGGDIKGVIQKLEEGYFEKLGVSAIWMTPVVEQISGMVDEGTGPTYGYHGYWARDWTRIDPAYGTADDLKELVDKAHARGIRVLMDIVINHTGPVSPQDSQWPENWVRTEPTCAYTDFETTVECTLVDNLPDIRTDSDTAVDLPDFLREKWAAEGRLEKEIAELDAFFERTRHPRAPRFYIVKWLTDWVRELGIDGYRFDTAKHIEPKVCAEVKKEAALAFQEWKKRNPEKVLDDAGFYMVGEVYGYGIGAGRWFDYGDQKADFFAEGFESLINFAFKGDVERTPEALFSSYSAALNNGGPLEGVSVLNYVSSHDDGDPFDRDRSRSRETANKLFLTPGAVQIYYGDETARPLIAEGANGDANLRTFMNWEALSDQKKRADGLTTAGILDHWQKLGRFRHAHPAVGAGVHQQLQETPYLFQRTLEEKGQTDRVLVAMGWAAGPKSIPVFGLFPNGTELKDYYSDVTVIVSDGKVDLDTAADMVLLGQL